MVTAVTVSGGGVLQVPSCTWCLEVEEEVFGDLHCCLLPVLLSSATRI